MFNKLMAAIVGSPEQGQRKMALGVYVISILGVVIVGCILAIVFVGSAATKAPLLQQIVEGAFAALTTVVITLIAGNGVEHVAGAFGLKKAE